MAQGTGGVPGLPQQASMQPMNLFDNGRQNQANMQNFAMPYMQAGQPQNYNITADEVFKQIQASYQPNAFMGMLPAIQAQLGQQSQFQQPMYAAMRAEGEQNVAKAQSEAGARGMRGSDIEAAGMTGARTAASQNVAQAQAQLAMQQSSQMAEYMMKLWGMDIEANKEFHQNLAMAIGQELSNQREQQMFAQQMRFQDRMSRRGQRASIIGSGIEALGSIGGGYASTMGKK